MHIESDENIISRLIVKTADVDVQFTKLHSDLAGWVEGEIKRGKKKETDGLEGGLRARDTDEH